MQTAYTGVHKCPTNPEATSKFWAPEGVHETRATKRTQKYSVPLQKSHRPGKVTPGVCAPPVYMQRIPSTDEVRLLY